jgi:CBS domain-containing protein
MSTIKTIMVADVGTVRDDATLADAARIMWERDCGIVPVVDAGDRLCGVITDRDICMGALSSARPIQEIPLTASMTREVQTCTEQADLRRVHDLMRRRQVRRLPVVDADDHVVGILSLNDLALALAEAKGTQASAARRDVAETLKAICAHGPVGRQEAPKSLEAET